MKEIVSLIPARAGSRSIKNKNIVELNKHPLIAYSILVSKLSKYITQTIVTTNGYLIAEISMFYNAHVPFIRPNIYATDTSPDTDYILHFLNWCKENNYQIPKYIIQLRPTSPYRNSKVIDEAIELIMHVSKATSLRSAHKIAEPPYKYFKLNNGYWEGYMNNSLEQTNLPKESFEPAYKPNGYVDIIKPEVLLETGSLYGDKILSFITEEIVEIDSENELKLLEYQAYISPIAHDLKNRLDNYLENINADKLPKK